MDDFWADAEVISVYTRAQAIEDGELVLLQGETEALAMEAGFRCDVALTRPLFTLVEPSEREKENGQSLTGRLWDVLNMARMYSRKAREADTAGEGVDVFFPCIFWIAGRQQYSNGRAYQRTFKLWFSLARGDHGEPVVTIGFPEDR